MAWHRGGQRMRRQERRVLGLLLVVMFLGHDAFMATEALAAPFPVAGAAHHGSGPHTLASDALGSGHPGNCRIGQSAHPRSADELDRLGHLLTAVDPFVAIGDLLESHAGSVVWEEPQWPPGTLRALFQVYRI